MAGVFLVMFHSSQVLLVPDKDYVWSPISPALSKTPSSPPQTSPFPYAKDVGISCNFFFHNYQTEIVWWIFVCFYISLST